MREEKPGPYQGNGYQTRMFLLPGWYYKYPSLGPWGEGWLFYQHHYARPPLPSLGGIPQNLLPRQHHCRRDTSNILPGTDHILYLPTESEVQLSAWSLHHLRLIATDFMFSVRIDPQNEGTLTQYCFLFMWKLVTHTTIRSQYSGNLSVQTIAD